MAKNSLNLDDLARDQQALKGRKMSMDASSLLGAAMALVAIGARAQAGQAPDQTAAQIRNVADMLAGLGRNAT